MVQDEKNNYSALEGKEQKQLYKQTNFEGPNVHY